MLNNPTSHLRTHKLFKDQYSVTTPLMQILAKSIVVGLLVTLSGCAGVAKQPQEVGLPGHAQMLHHDMIIDLISVLPQILEPLNTTIQVSDDASGKAVHAAHELAKLGYGLQRVDADQGRHFLFVTELPGTDSVNLSKTRLRLTIGNLELTRSYRTIKTNAKTIISPSANIVWRNNVAVVPMGPLTIAGTRQTIQITGINVELANSGDANEAYEFTSGSVQYAALSPIEGGIPSISLITPDMVDRVTKSASAGPSLASLNANNSQFGNLYNGDASAFASFLDDYNRIIREFVIFPNDSQYLGQPGKLVVKKLASRFSENSDIVGIIGCSNGPTSLEIGNEGLALGRAQRIAEELVAAGISRDKVFDEGCWSPTTGAEGFPNRGVVIDLWRRAG